MLLICKNGSFFGRTPAVCEIFALLLISISEALLGMDRELLFHRSLQILTCSFQTACRTAKVQHSRVVAKLATPSRDFSVAGNFSCTWRIYGLTKSRTSTLAIVNYVRFVKWTRKPHIVDVIYYGRYAKLHGEPWNSKRAGAENAR